MLPLLLLHETLEQQNCLVILSSEEQRGVRLGVWPTCLLACLLAWLLVPVFKGVWFVSVHNRQIARALFFP